MTPEDDTSPESALPYMRLCQAIIVNAIRDASGHAAGFSPGNRYAQEEQRRALDWISNPNQDFNEICEGAGFDPAAVRKNVLAFLASGKPIPKHMPSTERKRRSPLSAASIADRIGCSPTTVQRFLKDGSGSIDIQKRVHAVVGEIEREPATA